MRRDSSPRVHALPRMAHPDRHDDVASPEAPPAAGRRGSWRWRAATLLAVVAATPWIAVAAMAVLAADRRRRSSGCRPRFRRGRPTTSSRASSRAATWSSPRGRAARSARPAIDRFIAAGAPAPTRRATRRAGRGSRRSPPAQPPSRGSPQPPLSLDRDGGHRAARRECSSAPTADTTCLVIPLHAGRASPTGRRAVAWIRDTLLQDGDDPTTRSAPRRPGDRQRGRWTTASAASLNASTAARRRLVILVPHLVVAPVVPLRAARVPPLAGLRRALVHVPPRLGRPDESGADRDAAARAHARRVGRHPSRQLSRRGAGEHGPAGGAWPRGRSRVGWLPCSLSAGTTALGLFSLVVSELEPIRVFGFHAALGVLATLALLFLVVPGHLRALADPPAGPPVAGRGGGRRAFAVAGRSAGRRRSCWPRRRRDAGGRRRRARHPHVGRDRHAVHAGEPGDPRLRLARTDDRPAGAGGGGAAVRRRRPTIRPGRAARPRARGRGGPRRPARA